MKIAIIGYYGHNNLGDELNLFEMMKLIKRQYSNSEITVFSGALPFLQYEVDYNIVLADTMSLSQYRETLNSFDLVIVGGGGLVFLGANYFNFLQEGLKVPYIFSRVGIDNRVVSPEVCSQLKDIFTRAYDVTVRTSYDKELAAKYLGIDCNVVPEAIWNYTTKRVNFPHPGKKILVSINAYAARYCNDIKNSLAKLKTPSTLYTLSMQDTSLDFYYNILSTPKRVILAESISLHQKASYLASVDLVITSRLHAGLVALSHGIPAIMLKSTPKVQFLLKDLSLDNLYCENITPELIDDTLNSEKLKETILERVNVMKKGANSNIIPK